MSELLLDAAGRRRSPATLPQFHTGRPPRNKGMRYPADPPTIEEIVAVMRRAGDSVHGRRLRGLSVVPQRVEPVGCSHRDRTSGSKAGWHRNACRKAPAKLGSCVRFERYSWWPGCVRSIRGCYGDGS
jgi:hypothetical protein